jgi:hypothetical protein
MNIRTFRNAIVTNLRQALVPNTFAQVTVAPRAVTVEWIASVARRSPVCMVSFIGIKKMERMANGQLLGPLQMAVHVVAEDFKEKPAHEKVLDLIDAVVNHVEGNTFGTTSPAQIDSVEYVWDQRVEEKGYAVASIIWDQPLILGRSFAAEDIAAQWGSNDIVIADATIVGSADGRPPVTEATGSEAPPPETPADYWALTP